jgi:hypothetical protein
MLFRDVQDFPIKGVVFKDITTLFQDIKSFQENDKCCFFGFYRCVCKFKRQAKNIRHTDKLI